MAFQAIHHTQSIQDLVPLKKQYDENDFIIIEFSYHKCVDCKDNLLIVNTKTGSEIICYECNYQYVPQDNLSYLKCDISNKAASQEIINNSEGEQIA